VSILPSYTAGCCWAQARCSDAARVRAYARVRTLPVAGPWHGAQPGVASAAYHPNHPGWRPAAGFLNPLTWQLIFVYRFCNRWCSALPQAANGLSPTNSALLFQTGGRVLLFHRGVALLCPVWAVPNAQGLAHLGGGESRLPR